MNVDEALRQLADRHDFPREAMRWAVDNWEAASPRLISRLRAFASGGERSEAAEDEVFCILHLCGDKGETRAYEPTCRLIADDPDIDAWLGDAVTEHLRGILIKVFDGDLGPLQEAIESPTGDGFARAAALEALGYLARARAVMTDEAMRGYLLRLKHEMQPREESFLWSTWATTAANLGYDDFKPEVARLIEDGFIADYNFDLDDFDFRTQRAHDDAAGLAGFEDDGVRPFENAIETLASWGLREWDEEFEADDDDFAEAAEWDAPLAPYVNPFRDVGRNDPCPCGSGKKYKKCCLGA